MEAAQELWCVVLVFILTPTLTCLQASGCERLSSVARASRREQRWRVVILIIACSGRGARAGPSRSLLGKAV